MIMKLEMSPLIFADLFNRQPPPRVNTNAFEVTGPSKMLVSSDGSLVQWQWLITPKAKGSHALMVDLSSYVAQWGYIQEVHTYSIEVLNELGLSDRQDALLKALGAVLATLGTVLGYPLWKRYLDGNKPSTENEPEI